MGRDVALAAGIAVRPPGPADLGVALEDDEVLDALLLEADRHPEAAEPGAEDRDRELPLGRAAVRDACVPTVVAMPTRAANSSARPPAGTCDQAHAG